jgi:hypothetical protein
MYFSVTGLVGAGAHLELDFLVFTPGTHPIFVYRNQGKG